MSDQTQAQITKRGMSRSTHVPNSMADPTGSFHDLTIALHVACLQSDVDKVTQLMAMGVRREARNKSGVTALEVAEQLNRTDIIKRLMAHVDIEKVGVLELLYAIRRGQPTVVHALMEMGVKQQLQDEVVLRGIFLMACAIGNTSVVRALIRHGPPLNVAAFEEIFVRVARAANNGETAELIREISDEQRHRVSRATSTRAQVPPETSLIPLFDEFIQMPETLSANEAAAEDRDIDEYW